MQDYIEKHLSEPITLRMIAETANYSPWHAERIFKELTGKTPFDYIRALRLSRAAVELEKGNTRIVDVAFDYVFESHEGFTRAFSKHFGMTPRFYSKNTPPLKLFMPVRIRDNYLTKQKGEQNMEQKTTAKTNTVFVQVVDRPARKLILKRGIQAKEYWTYSEEVGCEIWDVLTGIKEALYEPIGMWLPKKLVKSGTSIYAQGVEVPTNYKGKVPEGCDIIDLPACKMMVFQGQPYDDNRYEQAIHELWDVMKDYNPELYGFVWADDAGPRFQLAPMGYRGYIEARPVRQLNTKSQIIKNKQ